MAVNDALIVADSQRVTYDGEGVGESVTFALDAIDVLPDALGEGAALRARLGEGEITLGVRLRTCEAVLDCDARCEREAERLLVGEGEAESELDADGDIEADSDNDG